MRLLLSALVLLLVLMSCAAIANTVIVPGTHLSITPPAGWVAADNFTGFQENRTGASIVVTEMIGAPYSKVSAGWTQEQMAKRGMQLISRTPTTFGSHSGIYLLVQQNSGGETYSKWIICFGDETQTELVVATVKQSLQEQVQKGIVASLTTARIDPTAKVDPMAGLLFTIQAKEPYRLAKSISNLAIFTHKGEFPASSPNAPLFIIGSSVSSVATADQEGYAKARAKKTETLADVNVYESGKISIDGLNGIQLMATAINTQTEAQMLLYQVMLFDADKYYMCQGIAATKDQAELQLWSEMLKTFKRK